MNDLRIGRVAITIVIAITASVLAGFVLYVLLAGLIPWWLFAVADCGIGWGIGYGTAHWMSPWFLAPRPVAPAQWTEDSL